MVEQTFRNVIAAVQVIAFIFFLTSPIQGHVGGERGKMQEKSISEEHVQQPEPEKAKGHEERIGRPIELNVVRPGWLKGLVALSALVSLGAGIRILRRNGRHKAKEEIR